MSKDADKVLMTLKRNVHRLRSGDVSFNTEEELLNSPGQVVTHFIEKSKDASHPASLGGPRSVVDYALLYAKLGFPVAPYSKEKRPLIRGLPDSASCDAETIKHWFCEKYPSANIALFGNHVLKLDIDVKNGKDGFSIVDRLIAEHGTDWLETNRAFSGSADKNGRPTHYLFSIPPDWINRIAGSQDALGPGIDVIINESRGLLVEPSRSTFGRYVWQEGHEPWNLTPRAAPEWLMQRLLHKSSNSLPKVQVAAGNMTRLRGALSFLKFHMEEITDSTGIRTEIPFASIESKWATVLADTVLTSGGTEEGWEIFDDFSKGPGNLENYDPAKNRSRWEREISRRSEVKVQVGIACSMARRRGWADDPAFRHFHDRIIYISGQDVFADLAMPHHPMMKAEALNRRFLREFEGSKTKPATAQRLTQTVPDCINPTWVPEDKQIVVLSGQRLLNRYTPPEINPDTNAKSLVFIRPYIRHLKHIFEGSHQISNTWLDWCAFILQHPMTKINWQWLLVGVQGVGKDSLLVPLVEGIGKQNVGEVTGASLVSQFNATVAKKKLLIGQEIKMMSRGTEFTNELKRYAADTASQTLIINDKWEKAYAIPNLVQLVLMSNFQDAMKIEDDDRRWNVVICQKETPPPEYFRALYSWFNSGGTEKVIGYLLLRDIKNFNPKGRAPQSASKDELLASTMSDEVYLVKEMIDQKSPPFDHDILILSEVTNYPWSGVLRKVSQWGRLLRKAGLKSMSVGYRTVSTKSGKATARVWLVRDFPVWQRMSSSDRVKQYRIAKLRSSGELGITGTTCGIDASDSQQP